MRHELMVRIENQEIKALAEWGAKDETPEDLISGIVEEVGEVAHAVNKKEGIERVLAEIVDAMVVLSRLYSKTEDNIWRKSQGGD